MKKLVRISHSYLSCCTAILLDSDTRNYGGSGETFEWEILNELTPQLNGKWVLSGGLNKNNIKLAMTRFNPPFVDVSSGVELSTGEKRRPGIKEHAKIERFLSLVASLN